MSFLYSSFTLIGTLKFVLPTVVVDLTGNLKGNFTRLNLEYRFSPDKHRSKSPSRTRPTKPETEVYDVYQTRRDGGVFETQSSGVTTNMFRGSRLGVRPQI